MQTYSHLILTAALAVPAARLNHQNNKHLPPLSISALLVGSILPDMFLIILSIIAIVRDVVTGVFINNEFASTPGIPPTPELLEISMTAKLFEVWFFENPWVITAQNLFHSPLLLAIFIVVSYMAWQRGWRWGVWCFWLFCAAMLHTLIDIPLHVTDGPLLLFPLNWHLRFISPVSYWDPKFYGREWRIFEHLLMLVLLIFLGLYYRPTLKIWWQQRRQ